MTVYATKKWTHDVSDCVGAKFDVQVVSGYEGVAQLPYRATPGSSGMDLYSAVDVEVRPGVVEMAPTGLSMAIPVGLEGQIRPRSGLAKKHKITVANTPGTVDSDYRGHVQVLLYNFGDLPYLVKQGDRIAQLVIAPVMLFDPVWSDELEDTDHRGKGGFGSTGR